MLYITRYDEELCYGGPEEGGWWFTWRSNPVLVGIVPSGDEAFAYPMCRGLNREERKRAEQDGEPSFSSVLGGHQVTFTIEREFGEEETKQRPHYE